MRKAMRDIIPKKSIEDMLKEYKDNDTFYHKMKVSSLKNNAMPTEKKQKEKRQKDYEKAIIELELNKEKTDRYSYSCCF